MKIIKQAIVYTAQLPGADLMRGHLAAKPFTPPLALQTSSAGFVPRESGEIVTEFEGGIAFQVRIDTKVVPASAVRTEVEKRCKSLGRKVGRKERAEIKEIVTEQFTAKALIKSAVLTCFHHTDTGYLIVPTTSKSIAGTITHLLVQAVHSMKTETIHVSEVKHGLTARLKNWLGKDGDGGDDSAFGVFTPCDEVAMSNGRQKIAVKVDALDTAHDALSEAITRCYGVTSIRLVDEHASFRMTSDFQFKGIEFDVEPEAEDTPDIWAYFAAYQVKKFAAVMTELTGMFAYKAESEVAA